MRLFKWMGTGLIGTVLFFLAAGATTEIILESRELGDLSVHISVLTPPQAMSFGSEAELLRQIRPGVDGLILQDGESRGTFLPSVWESLARVEDFWLHLKHKAGLPSDHWSDTLKVYRYQTESFPDD